MGGELVGHHALTHVLALGQAQVLLLRHVAEHSRAEVPDHGRPDGARDVVVARADVRDQRSEGVEGGLVAVEELARHILWDEVHGDVPRALDHDLDVVAGSNAVQFA